MMIGPNIYYELLLHFVLIPACGAAIFGYFLGSIPFGIVITRIMGLGDLRSIGSGNIGATNVLRTGSKLGAFLTFFLDAGKAGAAALITYFFIVNTLNSMISDFAFMFACIAGFTAFLGHCYPIWLKFQGGKGVSTFFGLLFALFWPAGIAVGLTWITTAVISRYSSLSALIAAATAPIWTFFLCYVFSISGMTVMRMPILAAGQDHSKVILNMIVIICMPILTCFLAILIYWRHRGNISRLINGSESKIGEKG